MYSPGFTRHSRNAMLLVCTEQQTLMFFTTAVWGWEGWSGEAQAKQLPAFHYNNVLLCGRQQQPTYQTCRITAGSRHTPWESSTTSAVSARKEYTEQPGQTCCVPGTNAGTLCGSALQPSEHAWEALHHPGDHLNRNFQAHSKFLPSDTKQKLKTAAALPAAVRPFIALGFWTLGLGRSSASITPPHLPTARKSFFLMYPLSAQFF